MFSLEPILFCPMNDTSPGAFMNSIGAALFELKMTRQDISQLASDFKSDGPSSRIFDKYAEKSNHFKENHKKFKIPGFSAGRSEFTKQVLRKVKTAIVDESDGRAFRIGVKTYEETVLIFIKKEHPQLNNLLNEVHPPKKCTLKTTLLMEICRNSILYDVGIDSIKRLYEVWFFNEISDADKFIEKHSVPDLEIMQKKNAIQKEQKQQILADKVEMMVGELSAIKKEFHKLENLNDEKINDTILGLVAEVKEDFLLKSTEHANMISEKMASIQTTIAKDSKGCSKMYSDLESSISRMNTELNRLNKDIECQKNVIGDVVDKRISKLEEKIETSLDRVSSKVNDALSRVRAIEISKDPRSIFSAVPKNSTNSAKLIREEIDFINILHEKFNKKYGDLYDLEKFAIYHNILKCSNVAIFGDSRLPLLWLSLLGAESSTMEQVVSPTWSTEEDWLGEQKFVFSNSHKSRFLVLHDYDSALVNCYICPTLKRWSISQRYGGSKIICLQSEFSQELPEKAMLDFSIYIPTSDSSAMSVAAQKSILKNIEKSMNSNGVSEKEYQSWILDPCDPTSILEKVVCLERSLEIEISKILLPRTALLAGNLNNWFDIEVSEMISIYHTLGPWISAVYGASMTKSMVEQLELLTPGMNH